MQIRLRPGKLDQSWGYSRGSFGLDGWDFFQAFASFGRLTASQDPLLLRLIVGGLSFLNSELVKGLDLPNSSP